MLFSIMSRTLFDKEGKQPLLYLKQTFGFHIHAFSDKSRMNMVLEARYKKGTVFEWEVYDREKIKFLGNVKSDLWGTAKSWGAEVMKITDQNGQVILNFERESKSTIKQIADEFSDLYNPTHNYKILGPDGKLVAEIHNKHGIFKSFYDFECSGGTEDQKKLALGVFVIVVLMLKK